MYLYPFAIYADGIYAGITYADNATDARTQASAMWPGYSINVERRSEWED